MNEEAEVWIEGKFIHYLYNNEEKLYPYSRELENKIDSLIHNKAISNKFFYGNIVSINQKDLLSVLNDYAGL